MDIAKRIIGSAAIIIGLGVWYIDGLVFTYIGALTAWIATALGATGAAVVGVQIVGWLLTLGVMISLFVVGLGAVIYGVNTLID